MMREFGKQTPANIAGERPQQEEIVRLDESAPAEGLRPFHAEMENEEGNNIAMIAGGVIVGLLIIGGGIYAYESSRMPAPQQVALKTPAVNQPAPNQTAAAPPAPATAPETTTPDTNAKPPAPKARRAVKAASNPDDNSTASAGAPDAALNAPMTLTPDTAPLPEQSAPTGQTAMQQPVTAPDVSSTAVQPAPEIANNNAASQAPAITPQLPTVQLPAPADQPEQPQPAPAQ